MNTYEKYFSEILDGLKKAGDEILKIYARDFQVEYKDDRSPLTEADKKSNEIMMSVLNKTGIPILSEEEKKADFSIRKNWKELWLLDPIDGTKEFIKKNGEFCICLAFIKEGVPIDGIIYAPVEDAVYFTLNDSAYKLSKFSKNHNQFHNLKLRLPINESENPFVVFQSRSHADSNTKEYIDKELEGKDYEYVSKGSALKFCVLAQNGKGLYPRLAPTMEWDTAAGQALVNRVGMKVLDFNTKKEMVYNRENLVNNWFIVK